MRGTRWFTSRWPDWPQNIVFFLYYGWVLAAAVGIVVVYELNH